MENGNTVYQLNIEDRNSTKESMNELTDRLAEAKRERVYEFSTKNPC